MSSQTVAERAAVSGLLVDRGLEVFMNVFCPAYSEFRASSVIYYLVRIRLSPK